MTTSFRAQFGGLGNRMFQLAYIYAQARKGEIPNLYLQDEKYFSEYKDELRAIFGEGVEPVDMVSIHVRRTDYVNNPFYVDLLQTDYYDKATDLFPGEKFLVFSDDIEWCKQQDLFKDCVFSEDNNELEDLKLMAGCKAHIIANSSYSWWAATISGNKTVSPAKWFSDGVERISLADNWIKI